MNRRFKIFMRVLTWCLVFASLVVAAAAATFGLRPNHIVMSAMVITALFLLGLVVMACVQELRQVSWSIRWWRWSRVMANREVLERQGRCPSCAYDLTGNVSGVCPECGARDDRQHGITGHTG